MMTRVRRSGDSLTLRIPKSFAAKAGLNGNSIVEISLVDGKLVIVLVAPLRLTLEKLLAQVSESNLHHEFDTGLAVGRETW